MSDAFDGVRAQAHAVSVLRRAVAEDRVASGYLFEGPNGVGKERCAIALAKTLLGQSAHARIDKGAHPDVRIFRPRDEGARNFPVERLREEVLPYAEFAPFEAKHAFVIFPEADVSFPEHHPEAANALLKTLEEPKRGVHFVLLAARPDRLLPTIRSRTQRVRFDRLPPDELEAILREANTAESAIGPSVALADGRADRALALADDGRAEKLLDLALRVDEAVAARRTGALLDLADELAKHDDLELALESMVLFYRDVAAAAAGLPDEALRFRHAAAAISGRASQGARKASERAALWLSLPEAFESNANKAIALDALLHRLASC
ncbi:MAG: DNA polymerase III subunit [Sandaracinus sp.]|nr:DNA polymerase III subunit [Sandaracinus sp.]